MKKLLALILLAPSVALAVGPHLYSDPAPSNAVQACVYTAGGSTQPISTALVNNGCKIDLSNMPVGTTNMEVWFDYGVWGTSEKVPFVLQRPDVGGTGPEALKIGK